MYAYREEPSKVLFEFRDRVIPIRTNEDETPIDPDRPFGCALGVGNEVSDRLPRPRNSDALTGLNAGDEFGEVGFGLMHVHSSHTWKC